MGNVREGFPADRPPEEQIAWLRDRVDEIEARYDARVRALAARQEEIERRISVHERRLAEHELRLAELEAHIDAIRYGDLSGDGDGADDDRDTYQTRH
ncbi:hypothetical protein [Azospirillum halopraeferens]|uniref:hypothetical protein n=1 Tax=Azospirillum halopraeferens TaxID=34010 RepID=UPI00040B0237|nr:hypothetical protein [Azospirillum halopraeferens]